MKLTVNNGKVSVVHSLKNPRKSIHTHMAHHTGLLYVEHNVRPDEDTARRGDCVTRSIVMATGMDYDEVWSHFTKQKRSKGNKRGTASNGVEHVVAKRFLQSLGWRYNPCPLDTKFVLGNLPAECIVNIPGHYTYVKNGIVYDTYDCRGKRKRKLEGYYTPPLEEYGKL